MTSAIAGHRETRSQTLHCVLAPDTLIHRLRVDKLTHRHFHSETDAVPRAELLVGHYGLATATNTATQNWQDRVAKA